VLDITALVLLIPLAQTAELDDSVLVPPMLLQLIVVPVISALEQTKSRAPIVELASTAQLLTKLLPLLAVLDTTVLEPTNSLEQSVVSASTVPSAP
jgi:hypothetical protein